MKKVKIFLLIVGLFATCPRTYSAVHSPLKYECGEISSKIDKKKNITIFFNHSKDCVFYTKGKQDIAEQPEIKSSGKKNKINISWPKGKLKKDAIGNSTYVSSVVNGPFKIKISDTGEKVKLKIKYQTCIKNQCKTTNLLADIKNSNINLSFEKSSIVSFNNKVNLKELPDPAEQDIFDADDFYDDQIIDELDNKSDENGFNIMKLIKIILISFISGALVNFMPCVLPVLGIKLSMVAKGGTGKNFNTRITSIMSILGIITTFIAMALISSFIKVPIDHSSEFESATWGFIFQNQVSLSLMLFAVFILNEVFFGRISINFNHGINSSGLLFFFFSGAISTILATPCIAPIISASIIASHSMNHYYGLVIFIFIGMGFSLPYIITIFYPNLYRFIPKNNKFSKSISTIFAGFMIGSILWVLYIIMKHSNAVVGLLLLIVIICSSVLLKKSNRPFIKVIILVICLLLMLGIPRFFNITNGTAESKSLWLNFNNRLLSENIDNDRIVMVKITADWCIWCKVNENTVLSSQQFKEFVASNNIILISGDITKRNKEVEYFMQKNNIHGIPFVAIYSKNTPNGLQMDYIFTLEDIKRKYKTLLN